MNGILEIAVRPSILFISIKDRNAMTETTWTNCADQMPPDDIVIARVGGDTEKSFRVHGRLVSEEYNRWKHFSAVPTYWTPYSDEKWKELSK